MATYCYVMKGMTKVFPGGNTVLKDIWLSFLPGAKIGIIGCNGAGKSTLFKIMAGLDKDFIGEAWAAEGVKVGYLSQEPMLNPDLDVAGNIRAGLTDIVGALEKFEAISLRLAEPMSDDEMTKLLDEQATLQEKIDAADGWDLDRRIAVAMDALRCPTGSVANLSGGEKRRVALCSLLMQQPDMLLLDEPTNHLDAESVAWLERYLRDYKGTVVLVTHDRYFLDNVVGWILELDRGNGYPFEGNYSSWLEQKQKRLEVEAGQESARQRQLASELEWIRSNPKGRRVKSKARIQAYEELLAKAQDAGGGDGQIVIPPGPRLGDNVLEVKNISKAYEDRYLIDDLSFNLPPGGIVGVIGANGAGKSTLFKMLTGQVDPDSGSIKVGETVQMNYVDQARDHLNDKKTVFEEISEGHDEIVLGKRKIPSRAYCGLFQFKGGDQQKKVGMLSGGERNRVHLAKLLKQGGNLIFLDEPTNDLDVETLCSLEQALLDFAGCAVVISHDRFFLDRIATHILAFEGDSHVEWFEGNFEAYEEDKMRRLGDVEPRPMRYKPLLRA